MGYEYLLVQCTKLMGWFIYMLMPMIIAKGSRWGVAETMMLQTAIAGIMLLPIHSAKYVENERDL